MAMGSGLLALALLAADGPACPSDETTTFQVRVLTLDGLEWRSMSYSRLQPVARQGSSTIWTADRPLATLLADRARSATPFSKIMAVGEAVLTKAEPIHYIAAIDRVADGPMNQSSAIAFVPRPEQVEERFSIKVSGRKIDQGILTQIVLEESHVDVIHKVTQTEALRPSPPKTSRTPAEVGSEILNVVMAPKAVDPGRKIAASIQIPEVTKAHVEGEWMIPNEGVLLVSLGVKTASDDNGMAVVRERVAVIEACSGTGFPNEGFPIAEAVSKATFEPTKLAQPSTPSRSLPESVDPNGNITDLPPLPEALASVDLDRIKPAPNQPSPQSTILSAPRADAALARTSFDSAPPPAPAPKGPPNFPVTSREDRSILLSEVFEALFKAGFRIEDDRSTDELPKTKFACEKCDGDSIVCPADPGLAKPADFAGGIKLVPERTGQIGLMLKEANGDAFSGTVGTLDEAFKNPGRTETTIIPLGGESSLQIKATVVRSPKKTTAPATRR